VVVVAATSAGQRSSLCCFADLCVLHHLSIYFIAKLGLGFSFSKSQDTRSYCEDTFFMQGESATTLLPVFSSKVMMASFDKGEKKNKSLAPTISGFETDIVVSLFCTD
jgi:hypothetical protein